MSFWLGIGLSVIVICAISYFIAPIDSTIPPTPAFYQIIINDNTNLTSDTYKDTLNLNSVNGINIDHNDKTITLSLDTPKLTELGGVFLTSCNIGQIVSGINSTGYVTCSDLPNPTPTKNGGIRQTSCSSGQFVTGINNNGLFECATP